MTKIVKIFQHKWLYIFLLLGVFIGMGLYLQQQPSVKNNEARAPKESQEEALPYNGEILSGYGSYYIDFNVPDYEKATKDNKIILLHFVTESCRACRIERQDVSAGFETLFSEQLVGFRIHYNDESADIDEKELAKQYDITEPHTKIVIQNGKILLRTTEVWNGGGTIDALSQFISEQK